ncbi:MAG TPA: glycosyltransferase family 39 protein [Spirochaetota bacterium]|nr:glycosyltransferase family 39 protein [Spirochaetota bacterium]HOM10473.1 glycosyltransferase family 39 protein [Spirochaetota bacterium]HPP50243.1 glycosyltransferase family 39 protein [Spirochaetota bacterium]
MDTIAQKNERMMLLLLLVFIVIYKFFTFRMFDIGGDAINYWFAAKHIYYNVPYIELDHQTARFGLILPVWFSQLIFGAHPAVSLIIPNLFFIIHMILLYKIGVKIKSPATGFITVLLYMLCPYIIRFGTQVVPEAVGGPLVTASFYLLLQYKDDNKKELLYLTLSAFLLFWAYCAHELDIFLMPGYILVILLFKRNMKHAIFYSTVLFILFLFETSVFYYYTGDIMARYHAITGHHFTLEKFVPISFWQLFERYTKTQLWWRIPFYIYLVLLYPVWKKSNVEIKSIIIPGFIFFLCMLFAVKSINPIVPALAYKEVHLLFALPFMLFVIAIVIDDSVHVIYKKSNLLQRLVKPSIEPIKIWTAVIVFLTFISLIVFSTNVLPEKASPYYNNPLRIKEHKFLRFFTYYSIFNDAYEKDVPIVSDYVYYVKDKEIYDNVQKLRSQGKNLTEALQLAGVDLQYYTSIRPNMPVKSLNAVRKIFLNVNPLNIPGIRTLQVGDRILYFIIKRDLSVLEQKKLFIEGSPVVYATGRELKALKETFRVNL